MKCGETVLFCFYFSSLLGHRRYSQSAVRQSDAVQQYRVGEQRQVTRAERRCQNKISGPWNNIRVGQREDAVAERRAGWHCLTKPAIEGLLGGLLAEGACPTTME